MAKKVITNKELMKKYPKHDIDDPAVRKKLTGTGFQDIDAFPGQKPFTGKSTVSFNKAHKGLKRAAAEGGFDCDWGCNLNQQSRGCKIHAQLRGKI